MGWNGMEWAGGTGDALLLGSDGTIVEESTSAIEVGSVGGGVKQQGEREEDEAAALFCTRVLSSRLKSGKLCSVPCELLAATPTAAEATTPVAFPPLYVVFVFSIHHPALFPLLQLQPCPCCRVAIPTIVPRAIGDSQPHSLLDFVLAFADGERSVGVVGVAFGVQQVAAGRLDEGVFWGSAFAEGGGG